MSASKRPSLAPMLEELRNILLNNSDFPSERVFKNRKMRAALIRFKKKFRPSGKLKVDANTVERFVKRYRFFELYRWYLNEFHRLGSRAIFIEGTDAVGKTSLAMQLGRDLHAMPLENQSTNLFRKLFGMPKIYRIVVADYNSNVAVGLLFYMCINMFALDIVLREFKGRHKYAVIDSSLLRTLSSRIAIPTTTGRGLHIDRRIYSLVKKRLEEDYVNSVKRAKESLFIVFLYATAHVKAKLAGDKGMDYLLYEANRAYPRFVENYLRENERRLKKAGVPLISIELVTKQERRRHDADVVFVRTNDINRDVKEKARMIIGVMKNPGRIYPHYRGR